MSGDVLKERPTLFLGSRLKRLAERMQADVASLTAAADIPIQPSQYALLGTLDRYGPQTVNELTAAMELSQPSVTRMIAKLAEAGLVGVDRRHKDQRHKTVFLTEAGAADMERSKLHVWPKVEAAVADLLEGLEGEFLAQIGAIEVALVEKPLNQRARREAGLRILEYSDALAPDFRDINAQWIQAVYHLEETDLDVLNNPRERIIDRGGDILFVEASGLGVVGACGLQKTGENQFELTKMGVLENARGRKAGEFLLKAMIARAKQKGAQRLYILTNKKAEAAIHLYEKLGFRHDAGIMEEFGARYERCDVAMLFAP